ncbi:heparinase [Agrobacterium larrymoorei]|nr:heparinase II/III family protein [Agrobacterium larrymoorei]NTJ44625.1 heparinase [Agrobacterium larrymoorei]
MTELLPGTFAPFGAGISPEKLRAAVTDESRAILVQAAENALIVPWAAIHASDYREYTLNGNRSRFEDLYFSRRLKLNALVIGECIEANGRFLDAIIDGLWLICEESGWQLPAHNSHIRGGPRAPLPDPQNPVIDLFAAETGANLALAIHLLGAELEGAKTDIVTRVRQEIHSRIIRPYTERHFWWMGNGEERMNNWTAWITQNVLLSTFLIKTEDFTKRQVASKALASLDAFIKDYGEDGACEEGVLYYGHAALCMFGAMTVLETVAPGSMTRPFTSTKIRNMAEFIVSMHVAASTYFNFADSPAHYDTSGVREFLFGKAVNSDALRAFARDRWSESPDRLLSREWNLWYRALAILTERELSQTVLAPPKKCDKLYPGIELAIARDEVFALAVKAGNNGESHNHNDVGSLTLYKNGKPFIIDVGVETYTAKTFSADRYDIWTMQSAYHNLPTFDGVGQAAGAAFAATDFKTEFLDETVQISFDIANAYPAEAAVKTYRRQITLFRKKYVEVIDEYDGSRNAILSLLTVAQPTIEDGYLSIGGLGTVNCEGEAQITIEAIAIDDPRLRQSWPDRIYRVLIPFRAHCLRLTIN